MLYQKVIHEIEDEVMINHMANRHEALIRSSAIRNIYVFLNLYLKNYKRKVFYELRHKSEFRAEMNKRLVLQRVLAGGERNWRKKQ